MAPAVVGGIFSSDSLNIVIGLGTALIILIWLTLRTSAAVDIRQPPVVKPKIPVIGHILGMLKYQSLYFDILRSTSPLPLV